MQLFQDLLKLPDDENVNEVEDKECTIDVKFRAKWNAQIKCLVDNPTIKNLLKHMYTNDRSERKFRNFLAVAVSSLCKNDQELEVNDFANDLVEASKIFKQIDKLLILDGLSVLEMCLVKINLIFYNFTFSYVIYTFFQSYLKYIYRL